MQTLYPHQYASCSTGRSAFRPVCAGTQRIHLHEAAAAVLTPAKAFKQHPEPTVWQARIEERMPVMVERNLPFFTGPAFYREESALGRDMAVLLAACDRARTGRLKVLDVMAGSGVRGARYLAQAGADVVWVNDCNPELHDIMCHNLCTAAQQSHAVAQQQQQQHAQPYIQALSSGGTSTDLSALRSWDDSASIIRPGGLKRDVWEWTTEHTEHSPLEASTLQSMTNASSTTHRVSEASKSENIISMSASSGETSGSGSNDNQMSPARPASVDTSRFSAKDARKLRVSHVEANRLLSSCYLEEDYYDLIDIDSFGSDSLQVGAALDSVAHGGLLYLTSTDGFTSGGHRPARSLAAYGAYLRALPWSNEQGLRMLIGHATMMGAGRGLKVTPVFSLYAHHGPVFRTMLRVEKSADWPVHHYCMVGHCHTHGIARAIKWDGLSSAVCRCGPRHLPVDSSAVHNGTAAQSTHSCVDSSLIGSTATINEEHISSPSSPSSSATLPHLTNHPSSSTSKSKVLLPLALSGPMWSGPLHDLAALQQIEEEAAQRGWLDVDIGADGVKFSKRSRKHNSRPLGVLLKVMQEEADPRLPPGYIPLGTIAKELTSTPGRDALIAGLQAHGFAAARCHIEDQALRTNAQMHQILDVCKAALGIDRRKQRL